jgi:hypothetical protein
MDVIRTTYTKDAAGGQVATPSTIQSAVPCSLQPVSLKLAVLYAKDNITITHQAFVADELNLLAGDICVIRGDSYKFQGVRNLITLDRVWEIDLLRIEG